MIRAVATRKEGHFRGKERLRQVHWLIGNNSHKRSTPLCLLAVTQCHHGNGTSVRQDGPDRQRVTDCQDGGSGESCRPSPRVLRHSAAPHSAPAPASDNDTTAESPAPPLNRPNTVHDRPPPPPHHRRHDVLVSVHHWRRAVQDGGPSRILRRPLGDKMEAPLVSPSGKPLIVSTDMRNAMCLVNTPQRQGYLPVHVWLHHRLPARGRQHRRGTTPPQNTRTTPH